MHNPKYTPQKPEFWTESDIKPQSQAESDFFGNEGTQEQTQTPAEHEFFGETQKLPKVTEEAEFFGADLIDAPDSTSDHEIMIQDHKNTPNRPEESPFKNEKLKQNLRDISEMTTYDNAPQISLKPTPISLWHTQNQSMAAQWAGSTTHLAPPTAWSQSPSPTSSQLHFQNMMIDLDGLITGHGSDPTLGSFQIQGH